MTPEFKSLNYQSFLCSPQRIQQAYGPLKQIHDFLYKSSNPKANIKGFKVTPLFFDEIEDAKILKE